MGRTFYARTCDNRETAEFISGRRLTSMTFFRREIQVEKDRNFPWNINRKEQTDSSLTLSFHLN